MIRPSFTHTQYETKNFGSHCDSDSHFDSHDMGIITSASEHNVSAQMMTMGDRGGGFGNMTSGQQESYPFFNVIGTK
jgi:hypothetical protein